MTDAMSDFRWRSIALPALLPTALFSIGEGAILPVIPALATDLGATLAVAGFIAAMLTLGELFGDIPSGWIVSRIGERTAMLYATLVAIAGLVTSVLAPHPLVLAVGILLLGLATAVFALARHAFMTSFVPISHRARALSTLGGTFRFGLLVGPFIAALVLNLTGDTGAPLWIGVVCCVATGIVLLTLPDPESTFGVTAASRARAASEPLREGEKLVRDEAVGLFATLVAYRSVLLRLGTGSSIVAALRASRQVILPLWGVSIGLDEAHTATIIGIAGGIDFALFYTGGQIMDRFGRLFTAVPSLIGLGVGHIGLAFTHDLASREVWFVVVAVFLSLSNGIGAGVLMTLGADLAPPGRPAPFLGAWRFCNDAGGAAAPLLIAGLTAAFSLPIAAAAIGGLAFVGVGALLRYLPRYSPHR
ncbi:MFS transporter [Amnibacterium flavum]|uniref:MFS transporter n=1 Tax=Amnibacterium flavum TaxID=2173173 RepID=A0A2V1HUV1_9MICO|nr:MFS transporter [Amnibacterium flavum]PVZ93864.1 MFS transporter [Amnibacterium flavum]